MSVHKEIHGSTLRFIFHQRKRTEGGGERVPKKVEKKKKKKKKRGKKNKSALVNGRF